MTAMRPTLSLQSIEQRFLQGDTPLTILKHIDLTIHPGEIVALVGPSGAGKTTLLQIAGLLEKPAGGIISMAGQDCNSLNDSDRTLLRRQYAGFVYQFHYLLPEFSALENVVLPQLIANIPMATARQKSEALLVKLGLSHRLHHRPKKLSGGEQQRVAIARALANDPKILLADEPTGNLDMETSSLVFKEMLTLVRETNLSALIATHNMDLANQMDRIVYLKNGQLQV